VGFIFRSSDWFGLVLWFTVYSRLQPAVRRYKVDI